MTLSYSGEFGLPNTLRERLLALAKGEAALVFDAMLYAGLVPGRWYSRRKILAALRKVGIETSPELVRRGLNSGVFGRGRLVAGRGRPESLYFLPFPETVMSSYGLELWLRCDQVAAPDFASLTDYRIALHRELIRRRPGIYSRKFLASRLGIGKRTTRNYDRRAGIIAEQRFQHEPLTRDNWKAKLERAKIGHQWLRVENWQTGEIKNYPAKLVIGRRLQGTPAIFTLITQLANHYFVQSDYDTTPGVALPY